MPLPTTGDCKSYLRIEDAAEDILVQQLLVRAKATIESYIGYPLTAAELTYVDHYDRFGSRMLQLPGPFSVSPAPVVTDGAGSVIAATGYILDGRSGKIYSKNGGSLGSWPMTVVATVGLSAHPDYATRFEAIASLVIVDLVAHLYQNRNPAAQAESDEGGGSVSLSAEPIPQRIVQDMLALPGTSQMLFA